jgi:hypothetical protein
MDDLHVLFAECGADKLHSAWILAAASFIMPYRLSV